MTRSRDVANIDTILTTKGDIYAASAAYTPARLAVGNNGETLVADSSTSTGLRWSSQFLAGKNKIINGDFTINQRSFVSTTTNGTYGFDRWSMLNNGGTTTYSAQAFTAGTAPVTGYEATNFARLVTTSMTTTDAYSWLWQGIEDVRTFAGQTATISFWAKATSGTPKIAVETTQYFGTGGSPSSNIDTYHGNVTIGTTWQRYSVVASIPSLSGKTVGTNANTSMLRLQFWVSGGSAFNSRTGSIGNQNNTFDIWGVQIEAGSVATPFSTATGTLAGELCAAQRYYWRTANGGFAYSVYGMGANSSTTNCNVYVQFPVEMRVAPATSGGIEYSTVALQESSQGSLISVTNLVIDNTTQCRTSTTLNATVASGLTQHRVSRLMSNNSTSGYIAFSAEL